jgi:hypothetical protein
MRLTKVFINSFGSDTGLFLGATKILSCDPSVGEDICDLNIVATNLSHALSLPIIEIDYSPAEDWNWDDVIDALILSKQIPDRDLTGTTTLLNTTTKDWRLFDGYSDEDLSPEHLGEYTIKIEKNNNTNQVFVSLYNSELNHHPHLPLNGLHAMIEVREGVPAMSIGISEDSNLIHVISDTTNNLTVFPECSSPNAFAIKKLRYAKGMTPVTAIKFDHDDFGSITETRCDIANKCFSEFDFGDFVVTDDSHWEIDDWKWEKVFYGHYESDLEKTVKRSFFVKFTENGTHIVSSEFK